METLDYLSVIVYAASPEDIEQHLIPFEVIWLRGYRHPLPSVDDLCRVESWKELAAVHEIHQTLLVCIQNRYFIFRQWPIATVFGFIFCKTHSSFRRYNTIQ